MQKQLFILSPCGTSLLTNQAKDNERKLVGKHANIKQSNQLPQQESKILEFLVNQVEGQLMESDISSASRMSAELNGIIKYYNSQLVPNHDYHLLLCTDTWLGEKTANLVAKWLRNKGFIVEVKRQIDLQTEDLASFQCALSEIVKWCDETVSGYQKSGYKIVFNLTGGFKSVQGFLQTLATFYADETVYIFETAKELLRIPRLPVEMAAENTVRDNLLTFRRLSMNLPVSDTFGIPETLLLKINGSTTFSPWGDIVWQQTKKKIYQGQLHPSPSNKLKFSDPFNRSLNRISPERILLVNEKIDFLARYLETEGNFNLKSLDFKPLKGNPLPPSTHEIDAWSDQDAKRIFGHYENNIFVLDKLDNALH